MSTKSSSGKLDSLSSLIIISKYAGLFACSQMRAFGTLNRFTRKSFEVLLTPTLRTLSKKKGKRKVQGVP